MALWCARAVSPHQDFSFFSLLGCKNFHASFPVDLNIFWLPPSFPSPRSWWGTQISGLLGFTSLARGLGLVLSLLGAKSIRRNWHLLWCSPKNTPDGGTRKEWWHLFGLEYLQQTLAGWMELVLSSPSADSCVFLLHAQH